MLQACLSFESYDPALRRVSCFSVFLWLWAVIGLLTGVRFDLIIVYLGLVRLRIDRRRRQKTVKSPNI